MRSSASAPRMTRTREKFYALVEFPYPSGQGLHVGHPRSYTALDIVARKKRMQGYNVLYPMGWDAFGLPTELCHQEPCSSGRGHQEEHRTLQEPAQEPRSVVRLVAWINTTDPSYYKWTQWIFLQLFKKGLAYKRNERKLVYLLQVRSGERGCQRRL